MIYEQFWEGYQIQSEIFQNTAHRLWQRMKSLQRQRRKRRRRGGWWIKTNKETGQRVESRSDLATYIYFAFANKQRPVNSRRGNAWLSDAAALRSVRTSRLGFPWQTKSHQRIRRPAHKKLRWKANTSSLRGLHKTLLLVDIKTCCNISPCLTKETLSHAWWGC